MESSTIYPSSVNGRVQAPASKSVMLRALVASLLCDGESSLFGYTPCDDAESAIRAIEVLGAKVQHDKGILKIEGNPPRKVQAKPISVHCGESGLLLRMLASVGMLYSQDLELTGKGSLLNRPFGMNPTYFNQIGLQQVESTSSILHLRGQLQASKVQVDGSKGSQVLSGLLMTLPLLPNDTELVVDNLQSKPYIDLTISTLKAFGVEVENKNYSHFFIKGNQRYKACSYTIEGDWSGASCLLVAGAIAGSVTVSGLNPQSLQADLTIVDVLKSCGAEVSIDTDTITVSHAELKSFEFDATHCPDLFPALVALAAACKGTSYIKGATRLKHKESDRATVLQQEFAKLQVSIAINGDVMEIIGGSISGGEVFAHNDHRIAMALAVAGLRASGAVTINGIECVAKSYPNFFKDIESISCK